MTKLINLTFDGGLVDELVMDRARYLSREHARKTDTVIASMLKRWNSERVPSVCWQNGKIIGLAFTDCQSIDDLKVHYEPADGPQP